MSTIFEFMAHHPEAVLIVLILLVLLVIVWAWPRGRKGGHRPGRHK